MGARSKEAVVCILDVSQHMIGGGSPSHFESAVQALEMLVQQKLLVKPKDEMALVLVGTERTANPLAESLGGYEHITVMRNLGVTDMGLLRTLQGLEPSNTSGDLMDALVVALSVLAGGTSGKYERRIFYVTNGASPMDEGGQLDTIVDQFQQMSCKLDVIGIDFEADGATPLSPQKTQTVALFHTLTERLNGHVLPVHKAMEIMSVIRSRSVTPTSKMRGTIDIGGVVHIPVRTYGKTMEAKLPTMKKQSTVAPEGGDGAVGLDRQYRSSADVTKEIPFEDRVKSYRYGKELFPVSLSDEAMMKYETEKCLTLLCFTPASRIPRHYFLSGVDVVVPEPGSSSGNLGLCALAHALRDTQRVAIVRYVKRKNAAPILGVMTPCIVNSFADAHVLGEDSSSFVCLLLNVLPFAEDLRLYTFPSFQANPKLIPSQAQLTAAENLIVSLDLMHADVDSSGRRSEALQPTETFNPTLQLFYKWLSARAMTPGCPIPTVDGVVKRAVEPDAALFTAAAPQLKEFKSQFGLTPNEKARMKKRRYWGEGIDGKGGKQDDVTTSSDAVPSGVPLKPSAVTVGDVDARTAKRKHVGGGDGDVSVGDLFDKSEVSQVGTVDPVGNFNAMIARRDVDLMDKAITGMQKQIERFIGEGSSFYGKVFECLAALRKGCAENYEEDAYNKFMLTLKRTNSPSAFWDALCGHRELGLITVEESGSGSVSKAESDAYWADDITPTTVPTTTITQPPPASDVFDDMD